MSNPDDEIRKRMRLMAILTLMTLGIVVTVRLWQYVFSPIG